MSIEEKFVKLLNEKKIIVATAESCTGGNLAGKIINVSGASNVFNEGFITYSNDAKKKYLNVKDKTLKDYGAVSEETAKEMAEGCAKTTGCDMSIVTTGIAGPLGGSIEKPVGLVYIGIFYRGTNYIYKNIFKGTRENIRESAIKKALEVAVDILEN